MYDLCIEPKTFQVLVESTNKKGETSAKYVDTKLMTRETYSLYGINGKLTTDGNSFGGKFSVPSYRTGAFLDPKGRGMYTGYDQAQGLMGLTASDDMLLFDENNKKFDTLGGEIEFKVTGASADG